MKQVGYSSSIDPSSHDGVRTRSSKSTQPVQGDVFGIFKIVGENPKRVKGKLTWDCECIAAHHPVQLEHSVLAFGVTATQCPQCLAEERASAAAKSVAARRVLAECLLDAKAVRIQQFEQAAQEQEQEQDARPKEQLHV